MTQLEKKFADVPARGESMGRGRWLPWVTFALLTALGLAFWTSHESDRRERVTLETRVMADQLRYRLESWIESRMAVVAHFADDWYPTYDQDPAAFQREATAFVERFPGMQAINWVDAQGVIRIVSPEDTNRPALGKSLFDHPDPQVVTAFTAAKQTGRVHRTSSEVRFFQGGTGFAFYWPIIDEAGDCQGFLNGVVRVQDLIESCLAEESLELNFRYSLAESDGFIAFGEFQEAGSSWDYEESLDVQVIDAPWRLRLAPTDLHRSRRGAGASLMLLLAGFGITTLVSLLLRQSMRLHSTSRDSERRLRLLLESTGEGIFGLDSQGFCTFCNPSCLEILGYDSAEELQGKNMLELIGRRLSGDGGTSESLVELHASLLQGHEVQAATVEFETVQGHLVPVELHARPLIVKGEVRGAVFNFSDIRQRLRDREERKQLERQFNQAQRLESMGLLAGGVAHDFNNLLVGILGNASLVLDELPESSTLHAPLQIIATSAERASELTEQLLTFAGRQQVNHGHIDLVELVEEMIELLKSSISKGADLQLEIEPEISPIRGDSTLLRQVLMNLIINASDALGPKGGLLGIRVAMEDVPKEAGQGLLFGERQGEDPHCMVEVFDQGEGMDAATLPKIFDPFFTTKTDGRGLGLSATIGIVTSHQGVIHVQSSPGRGTRFRVYLPASDVAAPLPQTREVIAGPNKGRQRSVMVVDDEPIVLQVVRKALERGGFKVFEASSGEEALNLFPHLRDSIDVILMDLTMPGMGGLETTRRLRKLDPEVPIVMTSGHPEPPDTTRLVGGGPVSFLRKPFRSDALIRALQASELGSHQPSEA